jgi:hypothetical protein
LGIGGIGYWILNSARAAEWRADLPSGRGTFYLWQPCPTTPPDSRTPSEIAAASSAELGAGCMATVTLGHERALRGTGAGGPRAGATRAP